jgi:Rrf2 family iron-sulfur cluster assembly transcriptional regulator
MKFNKSTRYALYATMEMAQAEPGATTTVSEVANRYHVPGSALAKVFQQLVRAGLATGTRGVGGGYRLAQSASQFTVLDVINAFEPSRPAGRCLLAELEESCDSYAACKLGRLFDEVEEMSRNTFASISLETLVR